MRQHIYTEQSFEYTVDTSHTASGIVFARLIETKLLTAVFVESLMIANGKIMWIALIMSVPEVLGIKLDVLKEIV